MGARVTKAALRLPAAERTSVAEDNSASAILDAPGRARCDLRACAKRYQSFDAGDCTYQAYGGCPRRECEIAATTGDQLETVRAEPTTAARPSVMRHQFGLVRCWLNRSFETPQVALRRCPDR
jgi:hypothetical protein